MVLKAKNLAGKRQNNETSFPVTFSEGALEPARFQVVLGTRLRRIRHAVSAVGSDGFFDVRFPGQNARVGVVPRTPMGMGTLAQRVGIHFLKPLLSLSNREQSTGLFSLTA